MMFERFALLGMVVAAFVCLSPMVSSDTNREQQDTNEHREELLASKIGLTHKNTRWNTLENLSRGSSANRDQPSRDRPPHLVEVSSSSSSSSLIGDNNEIAEGIHQPRHQYSCGRALANKKYDKNSFDLATSRSKYRPFEIRTPRIIGGDETNPGEFPWTVSVKLNGQPICGGSLINKSWILTAAHCVVGYNPKNLTVRLGAYRIKDPNEQQILDSPISLFIVHKQYSMPRPFSNDIALLKMAEPIEYSDFIIPICLPTEDHISSSLVSEIAADYLPKLFTTSQPYESTSGTGPATAGSLIGSEDFETTGDGIVVSTKMSDKEISKCFKRLEQNYLNSIGLGTAASGSSAIGVADSMVAPSAPLADDQNLIISEQDHQQLQQQQQKKKNYLMPPMPVDLIPVKVTSQLQHNGQPKAPIMEKYGALSPGDSNSLLGPMFVTTNNEESLTSVGNTDQLYETHTITNNNNKISFPAFSDFNNFEQAQATATNNQHHQFAITNNQHNRMNNNNNNNHHHHDHHLVDVGHQNVLMNNQHNQHNQQHQHQQDFGAYQAAYNQQAMLWNQRKALAETLVGKQDDNGLEARNNAHLVADHKSSGPGAAAAAIKLTSLPISKELLREIQSVGSMQSLNLGLQQGDFVANMVEDELSAAALPSGYTADRERVLTTPPASANQQHHQHHGMRQVVRDTDMISNELNTGAGGGDAEPTKYSGMTGIVVGWGWVRENDNDGEQGIGSGGSQGGQRSFQSVTLQKVRLPILRNSDCEAWFRSQEKKITLLPSQFCAGYNMGGKDACRGDSGGPMIIEDNTDTGRYKLIGIVSAGIGCARPSLPGLYTRVASFLPWIHAQMQHH